jgi:hypothetical protein
VPKKQTYYDVLTEAVNDIVEHGYDSPERIAYWTQRLKDAAERFTKPVDEMQRLLRDSLEAVYHKLVDKGELIDKYSFGADRFTLERVKMQLRAELDRRILASANLIVLNKQNAISQTLQRFQGWATSIPKGGTDAAKKPKVKEDIRKSLTSLSFEERRVLIDQGQKFTSNLNDILAHDGGAIAGEWHSHWRQLNYNYRPDHKERDKHVYLIRGSWAQERGLVKPSTYGYTDEITKPAEEVFCRCYYRYIYSLGALPREMLTKKGEAALLEARAKMKARAA